MLADRARMGKAKNSGMDRAEVTIHFNSGFRYAHVYVGDGTLDQYGSPDYKSIDNIVYSAYGGETITLMIKKGSYISLGFGSIYASEYNYYYTSLDSTIKNLVDEPLGGNILVTENMEIYYYSIDDD